MKDIGIFYGCLVYHTAIWYFSWPLVIFYGHLVYFSCFGMLHQGKSGNPDLSRERSTHIGCELLFQIANFQTSC
jgi:hypothetical protein